MDLGSIFLILAFFILVAWFISRPLFERKSISFSKDDQELSHLLAERDRALNALQELEFDFLLGKIPEEDYPLQRSILLQQGADVLRQLDAFQIQPGEQSAEERIEAAVAARRLVTAAAARGGNGRHIVTQPDDKIEAILADRKRSRSEKSAGFCHKCGGPLQTSDRICPKCGTAVA